ncbi:MAG: SCO family protein [Burkholderiaceae bacterium]
MTDLPMTRRAAVLSMIAAAHAAVAAEPVPAQLASTLPGDSIYRLRPRIVDQEGHAVALASMRGAPLIVSMFYSSCDMVCPLIFETIKQTRMALPPGKRERVDVLMISFDPERDTVAQLKVTAAAHGCDSHWTLVRASDADVRQIAAVLGVQYRRLPSGAFNHSSAILLLDRDGRIVARTGKLGEVDPQFVGVLARLA